MYSDLNISSNQNPTDQNLSQLMSIWGDPANPVSDGTTGLYQQPTTSSALSGSPNAGSDTATNPFSNFTGANIIQNTNGTVAPSTTNAQGAPAAPATAAPVVPSTLGTTNQAATQDPAQLFSGFQQMLSSYLANQQQISNTATTANQQTQSDVAAATPAPVATPTTLSAQQQQAIQAAAAAMSSDASSHDTVGQIQQAEQQDLTGSGLFSAGQLANIGTNSQWGSNTGVVWGNGAPMTSDWINQMTTGALAGLNPTASNTTTAPSINTQTVASNPAAVSPTTAAATSPFSGGLAGGLKQLQVAGRANAL